ncbi:hypothetical protein Fmac_032220 [Flemingia macrophylla]|uniref:VQ domain-containing protein n=1 Tax=Flemingia macrophylla TaxID=520843 RepID=A0ABD1L4B8_9FABA
MMNSQDINIPTRRSPNKRELQLQGPRPTPLRINKDSHKIKKPPVAPAPAQQQAPPRLPVIIYTVSPKVIHTTPSDFMSLVQRLTGSSSSSYSNQVATEPLTDDKGRSGVIEMARTNQSIKQDPSENSGDVGGVEIMGQERPNMFHGILSPGPASLSPIPSNFFSPPSTDPNNMVSFFHDLSPVLHGNRNFMEGAFFMPSPSNFASPYRMPSIDLFNIFSD